MSTRGWLPFGRYAEPGAGRLAADAEPSDDRPVTLDVVVPHVVEEPAPPTDDLHQPSSGVMVALVDLQMLGQKRDALGKAGDLHFGRARIGLVQAMFGDRGGLFSHMGKTTSGVLGDGRASTHGNPARILPRRRPGWAPTVAGRFGGTPGASPPLTRRP